MICQKKMMNLNIEINEKTKLSDIDEKIEELYEEKM